MALNGNYLFPQIFLEKYLQLTNRHFLTEELQSFFQQTVDFAVRRFTKEFPPSDLPLFRARVHKPLNQDSSVPHFNRLPKPPMFEEKDLSAPPSHFAKAGRLNPSGMSYFYAANESATAIAETRPNVGSYVTVGRFELAKPIKVVDCRLFETDELEAKKDKTEAEEYWLVWQKTVCLNFTIPFHPEDISPYVPTQFYASAIKAKQDISGILYNSAMHPEGYNICLFDPSIVKFVDREQLLVSKVSYECDPCSPPSLLSTGNPDQTIDSAGDQDVRQ